MRCPAGRRDLQIEEAKPQLQRHSMYPCKRDLRRYQGFRLQNERETVIEWGNAKGSPRRVRLDIEKNKDTIVPPE